MLIFGSNGYELANNSWSDTGSDAQVGSFLVSGTVAASTPEPTSAALLGLGVAAIALSRLRRRS